MKQSMGIYFVLFREINHDCLCSLIKSISQKFGNDFPAFPCDFFARECTSLGKIFFSQCLFHRLATCLIRLSIRLFVPISVRWKTFPITFEAASSAFLSAFCSVLSLPTNATAREPSIYKPSSRSSTEPRKISASHSAGMIIFWPFTGESGYPFGTMYLQTVACGANEMIYSERLPEIIALHNSTKSDSRMDSTFMDSGSPILALYSMSLTPIFVTMNPPYMMPLYAFPVCLRRALTT